MASVAGVSMTAGGGGCKVSKDWKSKSKLDCCQRRRKKFVEKEAKGAAKSIDKLKTINDALGYDMFESALGYCSTFGRSDASQCTGLLTSLAGRSREEA
jgi:hypothetical protein